MLLYQVFRKGPWVGWISSLARHWWFSLYRKFKREFQDLMPTKNWMRLWWNIVGWSYWGGASRLPLWVLCQKKAYHISRKKGLVSRSRPRCYQKGNRKKLHYRSPWNTARLEWQIKSVNQAGQSLWEKLESFEEERREGATWRGRSVQVLWGQQMLWVSTSILLSS